MPVLAQRPPSTSSCATECPTRPSAGSLASTPEVRVVRGMPRHQAAALQFRPRPRSCPRSVLRDGERTGGRWARGRGDCAVLAPAGPQPKHDDRGQDFRSNLRALPLRRSRGQPRAGPPCRPVRGFPVPVLWLGLLGFEPGRRPERGRLPRPARIGLLPEMPVRFQARRPAGPSARHAGSPGDRREKELFHPIADPDLRREQDVSHSLRRADTRRAVIPEQARPP